MDSGGRCTPIRATAHIKMLAPALPVDVWLLVFAEVKDANAVWSTCRNVSRFLRACVDEFFSHGVLQNTFIDLHYSDIHTRPGPVNHAVDIPMVFDRLDDDTRAVFHQRAFAHYNESRCRGSVRGWVPFIEHYHQELERDMPKVINKTESSGEASLWPKEYALWMADPDEDERERYLLNMTKLAPIGHGECPPYYIKILDTVKDTQLVDLEIDCKAREISFDWTRTLSLFFREVEFATRAVKRVNLEHHDNPQLRAVSVRGHARAREKRMAQWLAKNKHRRTPVHARVWEYMQQDYVMKVLRRGNMMALPWEDMMIECEEIVPDELTEEQLTAAWNRGGTPRFPLFAPFNRSYCNIL
ncbi:hypothetical protein EJ04DRAFT_514999 [Polyplosphaeria fusca]|uniref:Uncharacterized protein n=1 Tax=Polyplosphaeria fusca TaxID=682080 RepID=A0A9P4UXX7_9PLEO|nr:hypothetical protein EJ04DRAFT_514999 [Polyplosphaeria fusca]